jgi:hypothetical protein
MGLPSILYADRLCHHSAGSSPPADQPLLAILQRHEHLGLTAIQGPHDRIDGPVEISWVDARQWCLRQASPHILLVRRLKPFRGIS